MVTAYDRDEWEGWSANGQNPLGQIKVIDVPGIPRIKRQKALFLLASHPELLEQYIPATIKFYQYDGLVFEDATQGITEAYLLAGKDQDEYAKFMVEWALVGPQSTATLTTPMPPNPNDPLQPDVYAKIIRSVFQANWPDFPLTPEADVVIQKLSNFQAELCERSKTVPELEMSASLAQLLVAVSYLRVKLGDGTSLRLIGLIDQHIQHATSAEAQTIIEELVTKHDPQA
jgi:hypothetical protein